MNTQSTYNGHKNRNFWNVSLWINNDECLHSIACNALENYNNDVSLAAQSIYCALNGESTPDGEPYSVSAIESAIEDLV